MQKRQLTILSVAYNLSRLGAIGPKCTNLLLETYLKQRYLFLNDWSRYQISVEDAIGITYADIK